MSEEATFRARRIRPFTQIDNEMVKDQRLSIQALGLGVRMLSLDTDKVYSAKWIQSMAGVGRDKLKKLFAELETAGYLQKEQTHDKKGKFSRNSYVIVDIPSQSPFTEKPSTVLPSTENQSTVSISKNNNIPPIIPQGDGVLSRFERFWTFYRDVVCATDHSRAGNKGAAREAWTKLNPDKQLADRIALYLAAQVRTEMWRHGIGIPYASTLLNRIRNKKIDLTPPEVTQEQQPALPDEQQEEAFGVWH